MLVVLPFSGVPVFVAGTPGQAFRDAAIVLPLYAAFALAVASAGETALPRLGIALPVLAAFGAAVLLRVPGAPSLLVGVIATKVWLAYVPMLAVGYRYVRRIEDFSMALRITALLGLIPAAIAIAECLIASRGEHSPDPALLVNDFGPFRYLYGGWYEHVRHSVVSFYSDGGHVFVIARVPSTFTSSTQFQAFALIAFAAGVAQLLRSRDARWLACTVVLAAGALASGARIAYVAVPSVALVSLLLARPRIRYALVLPAGALVTAAAMGVAAIAGADIIGIALLLPAHIQQQLGTANRELGSAMHAGILGHGTGWDTPSALRYGHAADRRFIENWYAKTALELGPIALAAMVVAFTSLHLRVLRGLWRVPFETRQLAAPVCAVLLVMTAALFKGPYIDLDPLNVYFWLLIGMLLAVVRLPQNTADAHAEVPR